MLEAKTYVVWGGSPSAHLPKFKLFRIFHPRIQLPGDIRIVVVVVAVVVVVVGLVVVVLGLVVVVVVVDVIVEVVVLVVVVVVVVVVVLVVVVVVVVVPEGPAKIREKCASDVAVDPACAVGVPITTAI